MRPFKNRAIVFSIDSSYIMPFRVVLYSLAKRGEIYQETPIFLLHEGDRLSTQDKEQLSQFSDGLGFNINYVDCSDIVPNKLPIQQTDHVSKATFYRLFVSSILPNTITSILYLDCDIVVTGSLAPLMQWPLSKPVAAVDHFAPNNEFRLWGDHGGLYFNAGVLLMDLVWFRENKQELGFLKILESGGDRIQWWDQDVLNIAFVNNWQRLPIWYNVSSCAMAFLSSELVYSQAKLIHFDGSHKPWDPVVQRDYKQLWLKAYQEAYGQTFPDMTLNQKLKFIQNQLKSRIKGLIFGSNG